MIGSKTELIRYLQTLPDKTYEIEISEVGKNRTKAQNDRWQKIKHILSDITGHTEAEIQATLTQDIWGNPRHTKDMTTMEMSILIDRGQQLEAELGVIDEV